MEIISFSKRVFQSLWRPHPRKSNIREIIIRLTARGRKERDWEALLSGPPGIVALLQIHFIVMAICTYLGVLSQSQSYLFALFCFVTAAVYNINWQLMVLNALSLLIFCRVVNEEEETNIWSRLKLNLHCRKVFWLPKLKIIFNFA